MNTLTLEILEARSTPEPNSGCTIWFGITLHNGYGQLKAGGKRYLAHRAAWEVEHGPIPQGLVVRHYACANRACINVRHLRLGTAQDNADDCAADGHTVRGERVHGARLTTEAVRAIRAAHAVGAGLPQLAEQYGVSRQTMWHIATRKTWGHV